MAERRTRLDTPLETRRPLVRRPEYDSEMFGVFAEQFARFMGTARFLAYMTLFVAIWIGWNILAPADLRWDDYPFIFLTLMLSLQASYAAPLILLAQNRQESRDKVLAEQAEVDRTKVGTFGGSWGGFEAVYASAFGDRRVAPAIEAAEANGGDWRRAVADAGVDADFYVFRDRSSDRVLPWSIIDGGMKDSFFRNELDKGFRGQWTLPPKRAAENAKLLPIVQ